MQRKKAQRKDKGVSSVSSLASGNLKDLQEELTCMNILVYL